MTTRCTKCWAPLADVADMYTVYCTPYTYDDIRIFFWGIYNYIYLRISC